MPRSRPFRRRGRGTISATRMRKKWRASPPWPQPRASTGGCWRSLVLQPKAGLYRPSSGLSSALRRESRDRTSPRLASEKSQNGRHCPARKHCVRKTADSANRTIWRRAVWGGDACAAAGRNFPHRAARAVHDRRDCGGRHRARTVVTDAGFKVSADIAAWLYGILRNSNEAR